MLCLWIALITFFSTVGGFFLGIFISNYKKRKQAQNLESETGEREKLQKNQGFMEAFFELKENLAYLENISELIKEEKINKIGSQLKKIKISKVINLTKIQGLNRQEFELIDHLHSIIIARRKIEFYSNLYAGEKISLLEFRANVGSFIDNAKKTMDKVKLTYEDIFR